MGDKDRLVEGVDYYFERGLMVLTAHYLKRRGYCCGNRCRHCPYDYAAVPKPAPTAPPRGDD